MPISISRSCQDTQNVNENSFSGRFDLKMTNAWSAYVRVFHDQGTNDEPQGVTGRRLHFTDNPSNVVFNMQGVLGSVINEFKVGYNAAPSTYGGVAPAGLEGILVSLGGTVANSGIAGQTGSTGLATPGQLVRTNSAGNGRSARTTRTRSRSPTR
jgi:hypothetical protein